MKKPKNVPLDKVLKRQLKDKGVRIGFEERRFYLHVARLIARIENGDQRRTPTFDLIYRVLKALGYQLEISVKPQKRAA